MYVFRKGNPTRIAKKNYSNNIVTILFENVTVSEKKIHLIGSQLRKNSTRNQGGKTNQMSRLPQSA